jgi:glyoxylase-like metal-dependent hydrolase (beta-lactamase superfamily II)
MSRKLVTVAAFLLLTCCTARDPDARTVLENAVETMGATNLKTIEFSGSGSQFAHGQPLVPFAELPRFNAKSFNYVADYGTPGSRQEMVRTQALNPPRGGSPQPIVGEARAVAYLSGEYTWTPAAEPTGTPRRQPVGDGLDDGIVEERQIQLWETPHGFLNAAMRSTAATMREQTIDGKRFRVVSFPRGKTKMDGYINDENLVEKVETWMPHPVLGDMSVESSYANYRDWGGVQFPTQMTQRWGGEVILDLTISEVKPNVPMDLTVPEAVRNTPLPPPAKIVTRKIGDGLHIIGGQNAATIVVEFKDFLVAVEGPTNEERSLAVLAEIKRLYPSKPIRYLVNTHAQYNDHAGGVRTWAAEGIPIITHRDNKKWFDEVALRGTWTIKPDKLSQVSTTPVVEPVDDSRIITDGSRQLVLYHIRGNNHAGAMLMAYLPAEKIIIEADVFTANASGGALFGPDEPPPNAPPDFPRCCDARNFYDNVQRLNLDVKTLVPIHSVTRGDKGPVPWDTFLRYVGKKH